MLNIVFEPQQVYNQSYALGYIEEPQFTSYYPIAINADSTIYVFINEAGSDTLAIGYKREVKYDSDYCGFTVEMSNLHLLEISTFDSVVFEAYTGPDNLPKEIDQYDFTATIYH